MAIDVAGEQISGLPAAGAITGTEQVPMVQNGVTVQAPAAALYSLPITASETAAGVTPTSLQYPAYTALRYLNATQITDVQSGTLSQDCGPALVTAQLASKILTIQAGSYLIGSNLTLSSKIVPMPGSVLWVNTGVTLTINAPISSPAQVIISGPGTVTFGQGASCDGWRPEWFGGKPSEVNPTGSIGAGSNTLTVSSSLDIEFGCGIAILGAGAAPTAPTGLTLVNHGGTGTTYNVQVSAVFANSGVSAACAIVSGTSGASPNITATWTAVANAVCYLVFVNGNLIGSNSAAGFSIGTATASGILFNGCPATAPATATPGWFSSIVKGVSGNTITLNDNALATASAKLVRIDATKGLQACLTAADAAYGFGALTPGVLGARTNSILLSTGVYNLFNTVIGKGMFSIIGQGGNWIYGSVVFKNQIYSNAFLIQGSSHDNVSMGCTFDKWQMSEANIAYTFTPGQTDYYMQFVGYNGTSFTEPNSIYFLPGMRYDCVNGIWTSHGDDWVIEGTVDGGLNFFHQQLDPNVPTAAQFTDGRIRINSYQCQNVCIYLSSANGVVISGGVYDYLAPPGGGGGSAASSTIQLAPSGGTAVNNIAITGNSFLYTRTVLNCGSATGVTFSGNVVGGLAGTGIVLSGVKEVAITGNTFNFQVDQSYNFIACAVASSNTGVSISNNVFDMSNSTLQYAITTANATGTNTVLTASKVKGNVLLGSVASARMIDWMDLSSEMEVTGTYSFAGSYPTNYQIGLLSAAQSYSSAIVDLQWTSSINKSGTSDGEETGYATVLLAQAGGNSAATAVSVGTPTAVRMELNAGSVGASPTTSYAVTAPSSSPGNALGTVNLSVTCSAAAAAMASPTNVLTTLKVSTRGTPSPLGTGTFALKMS